MGSVSGRKFKTYNSLKQIIHPRVEKDQEKEGTVRNEDGKEKELKKRTVIDKMEKGNK